jgi:membrane protease YdiL (CAAX protease family)
MRSFAIFLGLIALGLAGIAVFAYPAWELSQLLGLDFKFHRVASRIAMLTLLVGFVFVARRLRVADKASLGYGVPRREFLLELARGVVIGALLMLPVLVTMVLLDMRDLRPGVAPGALGWIRLALTGLVTGLVVAFIEETFLRGAMLTAIARESGVVRAIALTSLVYAATHFIGRYRVPAAEVDAGSGLDMLAGTFASFAHPGAILDAFLCLAGVGVLLGMVRARTGNISACIGLHAGWVAVIFVVRETSMRNPTGPATWLLSDYDGFIGWMVFAWIVVLGFILPRLYPTRVMGTVPDS